MNYIQLHQIAVAIYNCTVPVLSAASHLGLCSNMYTDFHNYADPGPPTAVSANVTGCDSAEVTWMPSISVLEAIQNYSVKYRLSDTDRDTIVYSQGTTTVLQDLVPNATYTVSVAGINSCGGTSEFATATAAIVLQGKPLFMDCLEEEVIEQ